MNGAFFQILLALIGLTSGSLSRENHECLRPCVSPSSDTSKTCYYKFVVTKTTISDNERISMQHVINGSSPGPPIEICLGDTIVVIVENKLSSEELSIHWHGLRHKGFPHMDGVPMISQCPILPYTSFRYEIKPEKTGTYFYHAHEVRQQGDGLYGSLTVRGPRDEPSNEKILLVSARPSSPLSQLIHLEERSIPQHLILNGQMKGVNLVVGKDRKYLLRLVNANVFNCPISFFVDQHSLDIVAVDGHPIKRGSSAERVILFPGERFDMIIDTNQTPGNYIVGIQGFEDCKNLTHQTYLIYDYENNENSLRSIEDNPTARKGKNFIEGFDESMPIKDCQKGIFADMKTVCSMDLKGGLEDKVETRKEKEEEEEEGKEEDDEEAEESEEIEKFYVPFDVNSYNQIEDDMTDYSFNLYGFSYYPTFLSMNTNESRIGQINRMTFEFPTSPILSQPEVIPDDTLCSIDDRSKSCNSDTQQFCQCTQILQLEPWKTVDIVLVDQGFGGNVSHTFHVHGYHVKVVGIGKFDRPITKSEIVQLEKSGSLRKNNISPRHWLEKDSFVVPNKGYIVLRIRTDNIGYWLWEARSTGVYGNWPPMQFVMLVGSRENMPTVPIDFPTCGNLKSPASIFEDDD